MQHTTTTVLPPVVPTDWHATTIADVLSAQQTDHRAGLSSDEAACRLAHTEPNQLTPARRITIWSVVRSEITEPMILLLFVVAAAYALLGERRDALAIFLIILGIAAIEMANEFRARRAVDALRRLAAPTAPILRDGIVQLVPAEQVVAGDLVLLRPGEYVPADLRLLDAGYLQIDESTLTGESLAVWKDAGVLVHDTALADRRNMAYAGTLVTAGAGCGIAVATGMATEIGRIAGLTQDAKEPRTPLQQAMRRLAGRLVWVAAGCSVLIPLIGWHADQPWRTMLLTGLTLAFATIPEELPILITLVLGLGALQLSRRNVIIKRLRAAETLGSISAIASDKTGTITENRMAVGELYCAGRAAMRLSEAAETDAGRLLLEIGMLAGEMPAAPLADSAGTLGDPLDRALLAAAEQVKLDPAHLRGTGPLVIFTMDHQRKMVSAVYRRETALLVAVKGAPETVLPCCQQQRAITREHGLTGNERAALMRAAEEMAGRGLRVLAVAYARLPMQAVPRSSADAEKELTFAGLVGFYDPPRAEVPGALAELRQAGIRVFMLTGDHPATASAVAEQVGIDARQVLTGAELEALDARELSAALTDVAVFARITPEHKLRIVQALRERGEVVAVTGDGINDAPALREADIGVAMGETGADAAREAADLVLADDNFATVTLAVREGRKLFENLRKAVRYYLAVKFALVSTALVAVLAHLPVPLTPVQIIFTELFMDLGASLAFTAEPAESDVMARMPRDPRRGFMNGSMYYGILGGGFSLYAAVMGAFLWAYWRDGAAHAQSVAFATWMIGHVVLAFHLRTERQPVTRLDLRKNLLLPLWACAAVGLVLCAETIPALGHLLQLTPLTNTDWLVAILFPLLATGWMEVVKRIIQRRNR
ncbi:MAG: cation-translocating P-type ATPase [Armatimonadota bacterium]